MVKHKIPLIFSGALVLLGVIAMLLSRSCAVEQAGDLRVTMEYRTLLQSYQTTYLLIGAAILIVGLVGITLVLLRKEPN